MTYQHMPCLVANVDISAHDISAHAHAMSNVAAMSIANVDISAHAMSSCYMLTYQHMPCLVANVDISAHSC